MGRVGQLEVEAQVGDAVGAGVAGRRQDVDVLLGEHGADVAQQLGPVEGLHLDGRHEHARTIPVPLDLDETVGVGGDQRRGIGAVGPVHGHPSASRDALGQAGDLVSQETGVAQHRGGVVARVRRRPGDLGRSAAEPRRRRRLGHAVQVQERRAGRRVGEGRARGAGLQSKPICLL